MNNSARVSHTQQIAFQLAKTWERLMNGDISPKKARAAAMLAREMIRCAQSDRESAQAGAERGPMVMEPLLGADWPMSRIAIAYEDDTPQVRERIVQLLSEHGIMQPLELSKRLHVNKRVLKSALDHEWFEKTPEGYRMAETC